ncbi:M61 family metallopeptidase [Glaciecola sp. 1036]|uniref:M61 family metallopeptidase n=1 Tax=Alteromonadaceae TaxID=72275 RepID=UPI003D080D4F
MIKYKLSVQDPHSHLFDVEITIDAEELTQLKLSLPAWIPGSYMIRDFARNILSVHSKDAEVEINNIDKQQWSISRKNQQALGEITLGYRVFAYDLSVRSAYITDQYAFCNGTSVFLCVEEFKDARHEVIVDKSQLPKAWQTITSMPVISASQDVDNIRDFACDNYLELIDHPILIGDVTRQSFNVDGVTFHMVFTGKQDYDLARICKDLTPICRHHMSLFNEMPVPEYWFITLICKNGFGGLEHSASTILQYARDGIPKIGEAGSIDDAYRDFLSLCSHELFHLWHVKRNKPEEFITPDLSQEVYTRQLWIYEGFTSFYDDVALARTKVISPQEYAKILGTNITRLLRNPGRQLQSVTESSFYAWTKFYKQDASSVNHIVSYYLKGGLIALALDIQIRQLSEGKSSLDNIMQHLWLDYGKQNIGTPDNIVHQLCEQYLGLNLDDFLSVAIDSTMDLPLLNLLESIGLKMQLRFRNGNEDKGGLSSELQYHHDFGALLADQAVGTKVTQVLAHRPANLAGLQLNDLIIAINHWETNSKHLLKEISRLEAGSDCRLQVLRDGRLIELSLPIQPAIPDTCFIEIADSNSFENWLYSKPQ